METTSQTVRGWHPEEVKAAIRVRGVSLAELARRHGYQPDACRLALKRPWPRMERIIAEFIGVPPAHIWPDRYRAARTQRATSVESQGGCHV